MIGHRNEWFTGKTTQLLSERGVDVIVRRDNGAEAVGAAIAEQPDLVLLEDKMLMLPAEQAVQEIRRYCPDTAIVVQVGYGDRVGALLDLGATTVVTRQVPPGDVVEEALALLRG